jgi:hypothetical protein
MVGEGGGEWNASRPVHCATLYGIVGPRTGLVILEAIIFSLLGIKIPIILPSLPERDDILTDHSRSPYILDTKHMRALCLPCSAHFQQGKNGKNMFVHGEIVAWYF